MRGGSTSLQSAVGGRIALLVVTTLMALMMVAGPVVSAADTVTKAEGKHGRGDGNGGGKNHPKSNNGGGPGGGGV
jgi:hypothetical protein